MKIAPILSIVIPVYKSGQHLEELHRRLKLTIDSLQIPYELIFVEDRGGDNSWEKLKGIAANDENVIVIQHTRNFGQHAATLCGIKNATGKWIITMDDDLEHRPEDIPLLFNEAQKGYDLVYGVFPNRSHSKWRNITSNLARNLFSLLIPNLNFDYTSFRIMSKNVANSLLRFDSSFPVIDGYLSWITNNYSVVNIEHGTRESGNSNYSLGKLIKLTLNVLIEFSTVPLKISTWIGICSSVIGFLWLVYVVLGRLFGTISQSGYPSLMAAILFFGGIQMLVIGIMGEYIAKINFKTSKKPIFIVSEVIKTKKDKES